MTDSGISRRKVLATASAGVVGAMVGGMPYEVRAADNKSGFSYCLNTSTIRGQTEDIVEQIRIASEAGYDGIEPWIGHLSKYAERGGTLEDLGKRIEDAGLRVESAIGFAKWIVNDAAERGMALEQAKREMEMVAKIGGERIAAPPVGAHKQGANPIDLFDAAQRYRELLEVGDEMGVVPMVEVWGFSENLSRLGEAVFVAIEAGHRKASLLGDVYHIYKGGSDSSGLKLLGPQALEVFHMNDYPGEPGREEIGDGDRVFPGDGVAPLDEILGGFQASGAQTALSLELFNKEYWKRDALEVAKEGLDKMRAAVARVE